MLLRKRFYCCEYLLRSPETIADCSRPPVVVSSSMILLLSWLVPETALRNAEDLPSSVSPLPTETTSLPRRLCRQTVVFHPSSLFTPYEVPYTSFSTAAFHRILSTVSGASKVCYALYSPRYIRSKITMIVEKVKLCHKLNSIDSS
jgi:hypothetical protein